MSMTRHAPISEEVAKAMSRGNHEPEISDFEDDKNFKKISEAESEETEEEPIVTRYKAIKASNPVYAMIPPHCSSFLPPRIDPATPKRDPIPTKVVDAEECFDSCPKIISREEWGALPALREPPQVTHRVRPAVFLETEPFNCVDKEFCVKCVKFIQTLHTLYRNWDEVAFSFLIGAEGDIFEGRGWGVENAKGQKFCGIAYIGKHLAGDPFEEPTEAAMRSTYNLIMCGVRKGFLINPFVSGEYHGNTPEELIRDFIKTPEKVTYMTKQEEIPTLWQHRYPNLKIFRAINFSCLIGVIVSVGVIIHSLIDTYEKL